MDYREAMESAILYIEEHLNEEITVEEVACAAGYSYYHLTRQFSAVLGESVGSYIRKRRLSESAKMLIYSDRRILDIALDNGFDSNEAFSRAFKTAYGLNPHTYRRNRLDLLIASKETLRQELLDHRIRNVTVHPKIEEIPQIKAAGIRGETTLKDNVLPQLWSTFHRQIPEVPNRRFPERGIGICEACDQGNSLATMNRDVVFTEVAAVEVDSFNGLSEPFVAKEIPGGKYAVFTHRGSLKKLMETYNYIWGTWFLSTKETLDSREDFELYDERFLGFNDPNSEFDIYIPIR